MLPQTSAYVKRYDDETKCMSFFIKDNELLEKYIIKSGIMLTIVLKMDLITNRSTVKNIWKLKWNLRRLKSKRIFMTR